MACWGPERRCQWIKLRDEPLTASWPLPPASCLLPPASGEGRWEDLKHVQGGQTHLLVCKGWEGGLLRRPGFVEANTCLLESTTDDLSRPREAVEKLG